MSKKNRSLAETRMSAVQGLYEIEIGGCSCDEIILDYIQKRWFPIIPKNSMGQNKAKFSSLVKGVTTKKLVLDDLITGSLDKGRKVEGLDVLMKSILRAGIYEILEEVKTPIAVIIDEYVEIANAFYLENEPALVNAILDKVGNTIRQRE